jgi:3-deoxy-D-manno-octulosonic-acid transferase
VILVDRVGILGELYALAQVAYVGGGWGTAGLHSVLEPAAYGVPVLFGPRHQNAREAAVLVAAGAAFEAADTAALQRRLASLLTDSSARARAGTEAHAYVAAGRGAAERGADVIDALLTGNDRINGQDRMAG